MFRIAICDDEATSLLLNKSLTEKILQDERIEYEIETFESMSEMLDTLSKVRPTKGFDLLLSDILTTEMNGIEAAKRIRTLGEQLDIIFISTTAEYALDGYQVQALRYLQKPVDIDKLKEALILSYQKHDGKEGLKVMVGNKEMSIKYDDIQYIESCGRDVEIVLADRSRLLTHEKISDMEKIMPADDFFRCHRSYIVNLDKIEDMERYVIYMKNGDQVSVSQQLYTDTKVKFSRHK